MQLVVEQGERAGQIFPLTGPAANIGRGEGNDLVLPDQGVSRRHARIERYRDGWVLTDLGSTNGTLVNGRLLGHGHHLQPGDRVEVGGAILLIQEESGDGVPRRHETKRPSPASRHPVMMIVAALLAVVLMAGLVVLLVTILQPEEQVPTATPANSVEQIMTSLPVPTEVQDMMTAIVPLISTVLPLPQQEATPAPTPTPPQGGRVTPTGQRASGGDRGNGTCCASRHVPGTEALAVRSSNQALGRSGTP